jgi:hypothetical protein
MTDWFIIPMLLVVIGGVIVLGGIGFVVLALLVTSFLSGAFLATVLYAGGFLFFMGLIITLVVFLSGE